MKPPKLKDNRCNRLVKICQKPFPKNKTKEQIIIKMAKDKECRECMKKRWNPEIVERILQGMSFRIEVKE